MFSTHCPTVFLQQIMTCQNELQGWLTLYCESAATYVSQLHFCREIRNFLSLCCCNPLRFCSDLWLVWESLKRPEMASLQTYGEESRGQRWAWWRRSCGRRSFDRGRRRCTRTRTSRNDPSPRQVLHTKALKLYIRWIHKWMGICKDHTQVSPSSTIYLLFCQGIVELVRSFTIS